MTYTPEEKAELEAELVKEYGEVLTTAEATEKYEFLSFLAPYALVKDKETGVKGLLRFTHMPRFYFDFTPDVER